VNIASDAQVGINEISVHQALDGCEWNTNQLPYYVTPPTVRVTAANLWQNCIKVSLQGSAGLSGVLKVTLNGESQPFTFQYGNAPVGPGTYTIQINRPTIPPDLYTSITAEWDVTGDAPPSGSMKIKWKILGVVRHSQYNTSVEASCPNVPEVAWIINPTTCAFTQISLYHEFIYMTHLNGTGRSREWGLLHYSKGESNQCTYPPGASDYNSFAQVDRVTGACGISLDDSTVATRPNPMGSGIYGCRDNLPIVTADNQQQALKYVEDYCPDCNKDCFGTNGHIDDYTPYYEGCSSDEAGDYGNFWTADTYSQQ